MKYVYGCTKYVYLSNGVHDRVSCLSHDYNDLFSIQIELETQVIKHWLSLKSN